MMIKRASHAVIKKGEWCIDSNRRVDVDEHNFAIFADWGFIYLRWFSEDKKKHKVWHQISCDPEWEDIHEWLEEVEMSLLRCGETEAVGLSDNVRRMIYKQFESRQD